MKTFDRWYCILCYVNNFNNNVVVKKLIPPYTFYCYGCSKDINKEVYR